MAYTKTFTVTDTPAAGGNGEIVVASKCRRVVVKEDPGAASPVAWTLRAPVVASTPVNKFAAASHGFEKQGWDTFRPGDVLGYCAVASGSKTFVQEED